MRILWGTSNMRHRFGTFVLVIVASFFLLTSWSSGIAPKSFAERLGLALANAGGYNEIRAQYAGFFLAAALYCSASLAGRVSRRAALGLAAVVFGGLIGGRLVSLSLDRGVAGYGSMIRALYAIDAIGFAISLAAVFFERNDV
jgi:heme A synthase